jgi:hypothetical protein
MSQVVVTDAEYAALRATIRERGTARLCAVAFGLAAWGALAAALLIAEPSGAVTLVPLLVLVATFEINFFIHIGVERIGRYLQVFFEERTGSIGWESTAMHYGTRFRGRGLDPLFSIVFALASAVNFLSPFAVAERRPGWIVMSLVAHLVFTYRIVRARQFSSAQRSIELEHFRTLAKEQALEPSSIANV